MTASSASRRVLRFGHSPDADDAFMFFALAQEHVTLPGWRVKHVMEDIESLNQRALRSELEVTAVSAHAYAHLSGRYPILRSGISMGRGYGPIVVARARQQLEELRGRRVGVPGKLTTAFLVLQLYLDFTPVYLNFDQILEATREGEVDAGLIIHEGQLTYPDFGLHKVADLGALWEADAELPLPLGIDVVRRDLGNELMAQVSRALRASIEYALAHSDEALTYALIFGRGLARGLARDFVAMYVNRYTLDLGPEGERALGELYSRAAASGLVPDPRPLTFV
jgi:1,4-dihydroxy-6-naphthoate synthase